MTDPHTYRMAVTPLLVVPDTAAALRFYAEAFGAEELFRLTMPVGDQFYGERSGRIRDPFGHVWIVSTVTAGVAPTEMQRRMDAMMGGSAA